MQCEAAKEAWNRAFDKLNTIPPSDTAGMFLHSVTAVTEVQAFLVAAGILSDLFFPDDTGDASRGKVLCNLYDVKPDSPLASKKIRNSFVHADERLDKYLRANAGKRVGPFAVLHWGGPPPTTGKAPALRIIDTMGPSPGNWRIMVRGEELLLLPLLLEVDRVGRAFPLEVGGPTGKVSITFQPAKA